ncbi:hypothetical protein A3A39_00270 [Candidatus Kaiserbacteria bacterium RIFCSPLOWO2_01_FULL_54_13]|uniref:Guanylate kinase-like domain-containing protein n=1 Tax=Candidatus Kaiserbacteria bacterium RIFCSPLOWO2_01_FULL_54_13 TaxID=1798512 RepID=A0A1F6F3R2_9BACT|nr:MAG: hypothetical protein A3A39_00270 [Candidatus Kaiserbacteria bacterium RIFCSPLOWO2_01_FULL_54_13]
MNHSAPIIHRALGREREKFLPGVVVSFTTLVHPPARFGHRPRTIGLIELTNGRRVLGPLLAENPSIGESVRPRMRLSHITHEGLRVYEVAFEACTKKDVPLPEFPGYILALTGPSGVGKSTVSRMLTRVCSEYTANVPILTTREAKSGDDGEYVYTTPEKFERMKKAGSIVAATRIPSSSENRQYGYQSTDIESIWREGKLPVVVTEIHLLKDLAEHYGRSSILSFGLLPPGDTKRAKLSQLLHRLRSRGRESEESIRDRLKNAERDLAIFRERKDLFDHIVVNEDLHSMVASLKEKVLGLFPALKA